MRRVYYYDSLTSREARIWIFEDEDPPKMPKREVYVKKIMYAVFFKSPGLVKCVKLPPKQKVNALWYKDNCLPQVFEVITNQRPKTGLKDMIIHDDNARPHTALVTREYLEEMGVKTMPHPLFSRPGPMRLLAFQKAQRKFEGSALSRRDRLSSQ